MWSGWTGEGNLTALTEHRSAWIDRVQARRQGTVIVLIRWQHEYRRVGQRREQVDARQRYASAQQGSG
jgi:hypothetical protein